VATQVGDVSLARGAAPSAKWLLCEHGVVLVFPALRASSGHDQLVEGLEVLFDVGHSLLELVLVDEPGDELLDQLVEFVYEPLLCLCQVVFAGLLIDHSLQVFELVAHLSPELQELAPESVEAILNLIDPLLVCSSSNVASWGLTSFQKVSN